MARDYRYGHKKKTVVSRRSQTGDTALEQQAPAVGYHRASRLSSAIKSNKPASTASSTEQPEQLPLTGVEEPHSPPILPPEPISEPEAVTTKKRGKRKSKSKTKADASASEEAAVGTTESPSHHTELSTPSDSGLAAVELEDDEPVTKKRFFWLKLTGLLVLLVSVTGWLVYAPLILAFALKMEWIDEETRARWDSREARQPPLVFVEKVLPLSATPEASETEATNHPTEAEVEKEKSVNFTFYEELPKAAIELTAQPLPVRTKSPTYLQLSAFVQLKEANEERGRLAQKGYLGKVTAQVAQNGRTIYVLRMGPYDDQREINHLKVELQKLGVDAKEVTMASVIKAQEKSQEKLQEKQLEKQQEKPADKAGKP